MSQYTRVVQGSTDGCRAPADNESGYLTHGHAIPCFHISLLRSLYGAAWVTTCSVGTLRRCVRAIRKMRLWVAAQFAGATFVSYSLCGRPAQR